MRISLVRCFYPDYSMIRYPRNLGGRRRAGRWRCQDVASSGCLSSHWHCSPGWPAPHCGSAWRATSTCLGAAGRTPPWPTSPGATAGSAGTASSGGRRRASSRPAAGAAGGAGRPGRGADSWRLPGDCRGSSGAGTGGTSSTTRPGSGWHISPWQCWPVTSPPSAGPSYTQPDTHRVGAINITGREARREGGRRGEWL